MTHDSKFAIISPKSVKLFGEIAGAQSLADDLASSLAEDVTYRLRETLQVWCLLHTKINVTFSFYESPSFNILSKQ